MLSDLSDSGRNITETWSSHGENRRATLILTVSTGSKRLNFACEHVAKLARTASYLPTSKASSLLVTPLWVPAAGRMAAHLGVSYCRAPVEPSACLPWSRSVSVSSGHGLWVVCIVRLVRLIGCDCEV
jgi:hypothetical protein